MRLANILRRSTLFVIPARAGIPPTWDRPDPPASARTPRTRRLTTDEKDFSFLDASSPTYMLVNSEVAEGTIWEAFPALVMRMGSLLVVGFLVGTLGLIWAKRPSLWIATNFDAEVEKHGNAKKDFDAKYGLKDLLNNPWKLNVWPESFPISNGGKFELTYTWQTTGQAFQTIRQINKEGLAYFNGLRSQAEESLKHGAHH